MSEKYLSLLQLRILRARLAAQVYAGMSPPRDMTNPLMMDEALKAADYFIFKCNLTERGGTK